MMRGFTLERVEEPYDEYERELLRLIEARYKAYQDDVAPLIKQLADRRACKHVRFVLIPNMPPVATKGAVR